MRHTREWYYRLAKRLRDGSYVTLAEITRAEREEAAGEGHDD